MLYIVKVYKNILHFFIFCLYNFKRLISKLQKILNNYINDSINICKYLSLKKFHQKCSTIYT